MPKSQEGEMTGIRDAKALQINSGLLIRIGTKNVIKTFDKTKTCSPYLVWREGGLLINYAIFSKQTEKNPMVETGQKENTPYPTDPGMS